MKHTIGAALGVAQQTLALLHRLLPSERIVYRIENRKGRTVGVFTSARRAELLGDPVEDLLNPRIHTTWQVALDPLGNEIRRGRLHTREPQEDGVIVTGLHGEGEPVEIVATSRAGLSVADRIATEAMPLFQEQMARTMSKECVFGYGRLHDGREGFGLLWGLDDRGVVFRNAWCAVSDEGFATAYESYRRMVAR